MSPLSTRLGQRTRMAAWCVLLLLDPTSMASGPPSSVSSEWASFRGPNADGAAIESSVFSGLEAVGLDIVWKRPLGSGYSGVVVAGGRAVTMFSDGKVDVVVALDEATGKELWRYEIGPTYPAHDGAHTGPLSTPLIANKRIFALGPRGRLFALDVGTGRVIWSTDLVKKYGAIAPHYGFATSPVLQEGVLIVQLGAEDAAVAGFDPTTGQRVWTAGGDKIAYQSPIPLIRNGRRQIVAAGMHQLLGIAPRTGTVLWEYAHGGGGARGAASLVPVSAGLGRLFLAFKDDSSTLIELTGQDDTFAVQSVWEDRSIRNSYNVPVYFEGHIYAFSSRFLTCVDTATGKSAWRSREPGDGFLILVDGHLVIVTKNGSIHVVKASHEGYQEVTHLVLFDDLAWTPPAFANGHIYVRSLGEVARVDIVQGAAPTETSSRPQVAIAGSRFGRFLAEVESATDKKAVVDRFMASHQRFPVTEGDDRVHFVYRGPGSDLAIAGDMFGARQERSMTRLEGTDFFYYSTKLEPDARLNYLLIKDYEQLTDPLNPRKTTTSIMGKDMEMSFSGEEMEMSWVAMPGWTAPVHMNVPDPSRRGRMETRELQSKPLESKQTLHVYLPAGYGAGDRRYPVAYVHGAASVKDEARLPRALDNLIGKSVAPLIAVLINDFPWGRTDEYAAMFAEELVPFIDGNYRTIPSVEARANVGMGVGGIPALHCAFKHPAVVRKVASQSAFLLESNYASIEALVTTANDKPLQIYLEWGKYDFRNPHEAWDMGAGNQRLGELLRSRGYTLAGGEVHDGCGWSSWQNRWDLVFENLFPLKRGSEAVTPGQTHR